MIGTAGVLFRGALDPEIAKQPGSFPASFARIASEPGVYALTKKQEASLLPVFCRSGMSLIPRPNYIEAAASRTSAKSGRSW